MRAIFSFEWLWLDSSDIYCWPKVLISGLSVLANHRLVYATLPTVGLCDVERSLSTQTV
jgi:hypothetical protein